ncbi:hypothetical protein C8F04DRAFT_1264271 [Mycena alexandri]|uniref:Uncharacterized protein n=1 Tax=Mycena alexandri TaxID=1745969 RepID=A0AAD6SLI0_9AGAR|nr:hypothetical protein C8F04DRAFT_1264271 [Mycena alexandri]
MAKGKRSGKKHAEETTDAMEERREKKCIQMAERRAAVKAKRRVSDGPRHAKLAASKLAAAEVAASEVLTKMLELKQAPNEPSQPDEEEEELSEWEPPGPETFALWRANQAKEKAELQASGEWSESEEECGGGSRQGTPLESVSGRSSDVAHETGGHVEPGARNASNSSARRRSTPYWGHGRRNSNPLLHTRGRGDVDGRRRLNRVRNEGVVVGRGRVVLAVHVKGLAPGLLLLGE